MEHSKGKAKRAGTSVFYCQPNEGRITDFIAEFVHEEEAERFVALWNAADGLTTEEAARAITILKALRAAEGIEPMDVSIAEAVKYITHGPEMVTFIGNCRYVWQKDAEGLRKKAEAFKAKLDKEGA